MVLDGVGGAVNRYEEDAANQWETRFGARVDILAAFAYLLGPISGTHNIRTRFGTSRS